jgi:hypothetical protein
VVRRLDRLDTSVLAGVTNARAPFVSPDGRWIGFVENNTTLKKVAVSGGPISLAVLPGSPRGASWTTMTTLIVATNATTAACRQAAASQPLTTPDPSRASWRISTPHRCRAGGAVHHRRRAHQEAQIAALDLHRTDQQADSRRRDARAPVVRPFEHAGDLSAVKFDRTGLAVAGAPASSRRVAVSTPVRSTRPSPKRARCCICEAARSTPHQAVMGRPRRDVGFRRRCAPTRVCFLSPDGTTGMEVEPTPNIWVGI